MKQKLYSLLLAILITPIFIKPNQHIGFSKETKQLNTTNLNLIYQGNTWYVLRDAANPLFFTEIFRIEGDTIIDKKKWQIVSFTSDSTNINNEESWQTKFYLKEDDGKIYCTLPDDLSPKLYFDFNAKVNDSLVLFNPFYQYFIDVTIEKIDILQINGINRKQYTVKTAFSVEDTTYFDSEIWIEGIGSENGIFYGNAPPGIVGSQFSLTCFSQDENIIYPKNFEGHCFQTNVNSGGINFHNKIKIYPNPLNDILNISYIENKTTKSVYLYDINGKIIYKQEIYDYIDHLIIPTKDIPSGLYIIYIKFYDDFFYSKILKK